MFNTTIKVITSRLIGKVANIKNKSISLPLIYLFKFFLKINDDVDNQRHITLNNFFIRERDEYLELEKDEKIFCSPAEGTISQHGKIQNSTLIQAKGKNFTLNQLFGGDENLCQRFEEGNFFTVYLAPTNYHRVHIPRAGILTKIRYITGDLHSVSKKNSERVEGLYCKNERVALYFESGKGHGFALILVGALLVGSIALSYTGHKLTVHKNFPRNETINVEPTQLTQLDEVGLFNFGSTVICLATKNTLKFKEGFENDLEIMVGQAVGYSLS